MECHRNYPTIFLWQDLDGAMRMGVGRARSIALDELDVESDSVPVPGVDVQVLIDTGIPDSIDGSHRLLGKGVVVRTQECVDGKRGFAANVALRSEFVALLAPSNDSDPTIRKIHADPNSEPDPAPHRPRASVSAHVWAGRVFAALALLLLLFAGKVSPNSPSRSHSTSFDMTRAPRHANVSAW